MNTKKEKEIKCFKRILKELGIYTIWIKERKHQLKEGQTFFDFITHCFYESLDTSLAWNKTEHCGMWASLYCASYCACSNPTEVIKDDELMNNLKEIINKYAE